MATVKMTGCMKLVSKMSQADQDALLARLDQYEADGVPLERAQFMAAQDTLSEIQAERTQIYSLIKEQHPDLLTVAEAAEITPSRQRNIYGENLTPSWTMPTETKTEALIYTLQDKQIDTKRVVQAITEAAGNIDDKWNAYLQEELYHGRTAKETKDFLTDELRPIMQEMEQKNVSVADFEEYLHNRHAKERNEKIAEINELFPDAGSGISTEDAQAYLDSLTPQQRATFESLAAKIDAITKGTRDLLVSSGLESQDTINAWEGAYQYYVPLNREDIDFSTASAGTGTGQGYSVKGSASKRATGSSRAVVDIIANIAMQRERAIIRSEKNRVALALYGLALQNPNPDFWLTVNPDAVKSKRRLVAELTGMGLDPADAEGFAEEPTQTIIDPKTGLVTERINPAVRNNPNVLSVRVNGDNRYVFFNANDERSQRMVSALKNLDADQLGHLMGYFATVTRYFASVNTQYNPVFGVLNFMRDIQGSLLNLSNTPLADSKAKVMAGVLPALRGIYTDLRSRRADQGPVDSEWATLWEDFQKEGGQTGYRDQFSSSTERAKALQNEIDRIKSGKIKQFGKEIFNWLADYNETMENATRLSVYKAGLDKGLSSAKAASIAKNISVNFNRKGQIATQAGALYAFFNASVQGSARLVQTLAGPAGRKIVAGGFLLGAMQAMLLAAAGYDDDEPEDFVKERNFVIPIGDGKYLTVPMPLGFNVIPNTSRVMTEFALSGFKDPTKRVGQIAGAFMEMFNPIGNAGWSVQTIAPTVADPLVALAENRDWTGRPIAKKDMFSNDPTPGYTRAKDTATWFGKQLSYYMNLATGGTDFKPGLMSPTPDQIDYLISQATGGVGREVMKVEQAVTAAATGEELPSYKVPLAGRFVGNLKEAAAESNRFYKNITELNMHENEIKGRMERDQDVEDYIAENPEAEFIDAGNEIERDIRNLRKEKRQRLEEGADKTEIKEIDTEITARMKEFNQAVREAKTQARSR